MAKPQASFKIASVKRQRVSETVAKQIRQAIFSGRLAPGRKKLPSEREMAEQFATSRVALREALRSLEQEGLIQIRRGFGGGAFVAEFDQALRALADSLNTVVQLGKAGSGHVTEVRSILEPVMVRLAASRAAEEDIRAIRTVVEAQEDELRSGALSRKFDMEFHRVIANACHNPVPSSAAGSTRPAPFGPTTPIFAPGRNASVTLSRMTLSPCALRTVLASGGRTPARYSYPKLSLQVRRPATLVRVVVKSGKAASHGSSGQRQRHYLQEVRQVQPPSRLEQGLRVFRMPAYVRCPGALAQHAWTLRYWVNGKQFCSRECRDARR